MPWRLEINVPNLQSLAGKPSRFKQFNQGISLLPKADFDQVLERLMKWLPQPFSLDT
jgi:hypothetical protein